MIVFFFFPFICIWGLIGVGWLFLAQQTVRQGMFLLETEICSVDLVRKRDLRVDDVRRQATKVVGLVYLFKAQSTGVGRSENPQW